MADSILDWVMDHIMPWFLIVFLVLLAAFLVIAPFAIWASYRSPTFTLEKAAWGCTQSHQETSTVSVLVGKVIIPQTSTYDVCDVYTREAGKT